MKEPVTLAIAAAAGVGGAASASIGAVIGIPIEALIAGLFGGLVALFALPQTRAPSKRRPRGWALLAMLAGSIFVSVAFAGFVGPYLAAVIDMPAVSDHAELLAVSFICGAGAQAGLLVKVIGALGSRIDQLGGNAPQP